MANMNFDFNKISRSFMTTKLKDGRTLVVKMPMKKTFEKMAALQDMDVDNMSIDDAMDTLGGLCAEILSHNMAGERVTAEEMVSDYDTEEMGLLIDKYMEFAGGVKNNPN